MCHKWYIYFCLLINWKHGSPQRIIDLQPNVGVNTTNANCTCVPFYLCKNGKVNTDGEGIIDIRKNEGGCKNYMETCCKNGDRTTEPLTTTPPPIKPPQGCGYRRPNGINFKVTGDKDHESQYAEFPWMVAVLGNGLYQCGAALIHPEAVITAAHCVTNKKKKFHIRAGEWDTQNTNEPYPFQESAVRNITIHPKYYAGALFNDIAFLVLASPVKTAANIEVICLPPKNITRIGDPCFATGWGKTAFEREGAYQAILKKIDLPLVPRNECQDRLRRTYLGKKFKLHESFVCAGGRPGKDTCLGDGGSPLVCPIEGQANRYFQAGIVAWGVGCGEEGVPGVYANVAMFRDWIDKQMMANGLNTSGYQF
ncbi:hypothetical protein NQ318_021476 [Aromia moschata]|uniref:Phenoloxidase-activating factor 2 n=1 Tax=Aromia moschata TaxID=1265417 RepID=A0AAV8ZDW6_9CUCU|nr:hypothetical protein NQ318_021476 [Aromia moschata]